MRTKILFIGFVLFTISFTMCDKREAKITTTSTKALELYKKGVELAEKFYEEEAIEKFQEAIDLDSTFVMAHYYLSRVYESLGNLSEAKASIKRAVQYSGLTTPVEWKYVAAWEKRLGQDLAGAVESYKKAKAA